jgi:extracellular elastinolytic metalloproteinase
MRSALIATLASMAAMGAHAHPHTSASLSKRAIDLDKFRMVVKTEYKNATEVDADPTIPTLRARATPEETASDLVSAQAPDAQFRLVNDHYTGKNGVSHFYFKQTANGLDIDNADFNVNIGKDGKVFSFGSSFFKGKIPAPSKKRATTDPADSLKTAVNTLGLPVEAGSAKAEPKGEKETYAIKNTSGSLNEPEAKLVYLVGANGELKLTWRVETDIATNWLLTYVDATSGKSVEAVVDYGADDSYQVYKWGINDPTEGARTYEEDPFDSYASEFGWHSDGTDWYKTTRGNNGVAQTNWENDVTYDALLNNSRPVARDLKFHYPLNLNATDYKTYANASVTQLFYTSNKYHDLLYQLGFDERAGNFEVNNNGAGGVGNDFVFLNAQDGSGTNNANFATPPDGQPGRMRMYIWTNTQPVRDCSFEAGVVIHEYTHGLSNRLTGGPKNSGCLSLLESGGMGEGWSDFYATAIRLKPSDTRKKDYSMGAWVNGNTAGIRNYLYSTSMTTNPQTYKSVELYNRVHPIGNIWASMLYEVLWNLIDKHGKNDSDVPSFDNNGVPTDGKYLAMKLVMDGMALQPCNPNFVQARDAIIDADYFLTGGANSCELWTAFAKRGLGEGARYQTTGRLDSFKIPDAAC